MVNREQDNSCATLPALEIERAVAARYLGTGQHPCADCRDEARSDRLEPQDVRAGTIRREPGDGVLPTLVCAEHEVTP